MPLTKRQAAALYNLDDAETNPRDKKAHKMSNLQIIKKLSSRRIPEDMAAAVFLRPRAAMRYRLLPALARQFAHARPVGDARPAKTPEEKLRRSLALILELADDSWDELPREWASLGSFLNDMNLELAREAIQTILANAKIADPVSLLKKFSQPEPDNTAWERFFWLNPEELSACEAEKEETLKRIDEQDDVIIEI